MEIFKIVGNIFIDDNDAQKKMTNLQKQTQKTEGGFKGLIKTVGKWGAAIGAAGVAAGGAAMAMANRFATVADDIEKTAMKLGVSTDALQEFRFAAGQVGVPVESMERALGQLNQRLGQAAEGNEKYAEVLDRMGISIADVESGLVSTEDAFMATISYLSELEDSQKQAALAGELFGDRLGRELLPAIQAGGEELENLRSRAHELGAVMSEDAVKAGVEYADAMDELKKALQGIWYEVAAKLLPVIMVFIDWIKENLPAIRKVAGVVFDALGKVVEQVISVITGGFDLLGGAVSNLIPVFNQFRSWIQREMPGIRNIIQSVLNTVKNIFKTVGAVISNIFIPILVALWDWISPHLPKIQQVFETAFNTIMAVINWVADRLRWLAENFEHMEHIIVPIIKGIAAIIAGKFVLSMIKATAQMAIMAAKSVANWVMMQVAAVKSVGAQIAAKMTAIKTWLLYAKASLVQAAIVAKAWLISIGPIALVIAAVVAAVVAIILIWRKFGEDIKEFFVGLWNWIKDAWEIATGWLRDKLLAGIEFFVVVFQTLYKTSIEFWKAIGNGIKAVWDWLSDIAGKVFGGIRDGIVAAFKAVQKTVLGIWDGIVSGIKGAINFIIRGINLLIKGINKISFNVPNWVPVIGGKEWGFNIPKIPELAEGGVIQQAGWVLVGEKGPEYLDLPKGAKVTPLNKADDGGVTITGDIHIHIDPDNIKDMTDIIDLFKSLKREALLRGVTI